MTRWVELRRHSYTKKGAGRSRWTHLSPQGVDAARAEGARLRHVGYVGVSKSPRTLETAVAMGFVVDDTLDIVSAVVVSGEVEFHESWGWPDPWSVYRERIDARPALAACAAAQLDIVQRAVDNVRDGQAVLLIGHGGWIEPTVVAAVDRDALEDWGPSFDHLEGVSLRVDRATFRVDAIHRRAPAHSRVPSVAQPALCDAQRCTRVRSKAPPWFPINLK